MEKRMKSALIHFYNLFKTSCQRWCQQRHQTFSPLFSQQVNEVVSQLITTQEKGEVSQPISQLVILRY